MLAIAFVAAVITPTPDAFNMMIVMAPLANQVRDVVKAVQDAISELTAEVSRAAFEVVDTPSESQTKQ